MKTMAYIPLFYGADYLSYAIRSIYNGVDKIVILYTANPSYGHREPEAVCPETEQQLLAVLKTVPDPKSKISWRKGWWANEIQHRRTAEEIAKADGYDVLVAIDSDEVWCPDVFLKAIEQVKASDKRVFRVPFIHFWRSFDYVCRDLCMPVRFMKLNNEGDAYLATDKPVYHFGYAITDKLMKFKWTCHGHKNELRPDWFERVWYGGDMEDVHPTNGRDDQGNPFWTPEPFDKNELPEMMREHPFYGLEKIK